MRDIDRPESPLRPQTPTDDGDHDLSNAATVGRHSIAKFIMTIAQWCAALVDSDHRRHDHQRPVRFWGDE